MRILVTISRNWDDYEQIIDALYEACQGVSFHKVTIVHGASQMDWFVAGIGFALGMDHEPHRADWRPGGVFDKGAGFRRNAEMVNLGADKCIAFIKNGSPGATDCKDRALEAGIPLKIYRDDPEW